MEKGKSIIDFLPQRKRVVPKTLKEVIRRFKYLLTFNKGDSFAGNRYKNSDYD